MSVKTFFPGPPRRASLRTTGYLPALVGSMIADIVAVTSRVEGR